MDANTGTQLSGNYVVQAVAESRLIREPRQYRNCNRDCNHQVANSNWGAYRSAVQFLDIASNNSAAKIARDCGTSSEAANGPAARLAI